MSERLAAQCSACGARFAVPAEFAGRRATCRKCGAKFTVDSAPATVASGPAVQPRVPVPAAPAANVAPPAAPIDPLELAAELEQAVAARIAGSGLVAGSADDDVMGWLNAAPEELSPEAAAIIPPRPREKTTAEWVGAPDAAVAQGPQRPRPLVH